MSEEDIRKSITMTIHMTPIAESAWRTAQPQPERLLQLQLVIELTSSFQARRGKLPLRAFDL